MEELALAAKQGTTVYWRGVGPTGLTGCEEIWRQSRDSLICYLPARISLRSAPILPAATHKCSHGTQASDEAMIVVSLPRAQVRKR